MTNERAPQVVEDESHSLARDTRVTEMPNRLARQCRKPGLAPETPNPDKPWLWLCGCLVNDAGAHRVGCPDFPEGRHG